MNAVVSTRRGDRERRELRRPEVADDRGVDEHVQRLGRQRPERRHGERGRSRGVSCGERRAPASATRSDPGRREAPPLPPPRRRARSPTARPGPGRRSRCCTPPGSRTGSSSRSSRSSADRFRLVLPDLPLHGDSEDRPRHPYSPDWLAEVLAGFLPRRRAGRARSSAATTSARSCSCARSPAGSSRPARLVAHAERAAPPPRARAAGARGARCGPRRRGAGPRPRSPRAARGRVPPARRASGCPRARNPAARDLVRHALADLPRQRQPRAGVGARRPAAGRPARSAELLDAYRLIEPPDAAAVGRRGPPAPARDRRGGARPAPGRPAARAPGHGLPDGLRRPRRRSRASSRRSAVDWRPRAASRRETSQAAA